LQAKLDAQAARLEALEVSVARLQEQLAAARKDSSNSSKPPSSDIVKPPKLAPPEGHGRRIGGQPGHLMHERAAFPPDAINGP
jgi:transposase